MKKILVLFLFIFIVVSCTPSPAPSPTSSPTPLPTATAIPTSLPKPTINPMSTLGRPNVPNGAIFFEWRSESDFPYIVWGANLRDKMHGNCQGFVCDGIDLRLYDQKVWKFLGSGEYGKKEFSFSDPLDTFVITWNQRMGIDAISGITIDGKTVTYGYLDNGEITASYMDGSNFPMRTVIDAENQGAPVATPCGFIDPNPEGDNNFNLTGNYEGWKGGGIFWNFLDQPFKTAFSTRKGYSLTKLIIVTKPLNEISQDQICP